jgi:enoyl-CoA hydratase/carnithine racemase
MRSFSPLAPIWLRSPRSTVPEGYEFSKMGQHLMNLIQDFPAPVYAAIQGYCMGGGLDLALACHRRIASPHAIFGHRGAALGLITGWGGTQRLARTVGRARALQMFVVAEKIHAAEALKVALIDQIDPDPLRASMRKLMQNSPFGESPRVARRQLRGIP